MIYSNKKGGQYEKQKDNYFSCFTGDLHVCNGRLQTGGGTLSSPAITLDGNVVSWQPVEHATSYSVKVGNDAAVTVTETSYTVNKTAVGSYDITVTAKSTDDKWLDSAPSNKVTFKVDEPIVVEKTPLAKPVLTLTGNTVSWNAVQYAASYAVTVGSKAPVTVNTTSYTVTETAVGSYDITVIAKANDDAHTDSVPSDKVTYVIDEPIVTEKTALDKPVLTLTDNVVSWTAVPNAQGYEVTVGKKAAVSVTGTSYTIAETEVGSYDITVVAKAGVSELYKDSEPSDKVTYTIEKPVVVKLEEIDVDPKGIPSTIYLDQGLTELDFSQVVITALYDNKSEKTIAFDDVTVGQYDLTTIGRKTVTISYTEGGVTETYDIYVTVAERGIDDIDEYTEMLIEYSSTGKYAIDASTVRNMKGENMLVGGTVALNQGKTLLSIDGKFVVVTVAKFVDSTEDFLAIVDDMDGYYVLTKNISFNSVWHAGPYIGAAPLMADTNVLDYQYGVGQETVNDKGQLGVAFTGTFDGQGYAITDIKLSCSEKYNSNLARGLAIFGYLGEDGVIQNLALDNVLVDSGKYTSFLVGYNKGTIKNITINASCTMTSVYNGGYLVAGYNDGAVSNIVSFVSQYKGFNSNMSDFAVANNADVADEIKNVLTGTSSYGYINETTDLTETLGNGWTYFEGLGTVLANDNFVFISATDRTLAIGGKLYLNVLFANGENVEFAIYDDVKGVIAAQLTVLWDGEVGSHYLAIKDLDESTLAVGDTAKVTVHSLDWTYTHSIVITITEAVPSDYAAETETIDVVEGLEIDLMKISITVTYTDGTTKTINPVKLEGFDKAGTVGEAQTVKAFYGEGDDEYVEIEVTVIAKSVESISIDAASAHKTVYNVGDELALDGLKIIVAYNNGTSESIAVTAEMLGEYDMAVAGGKEIAITYQGKTCGLNITVNAVGVTVESIAVVGNAAKTNYKLNETVTEADLLGATITATNSDGSTTENIAITLAMLTYKFDTAGEATITVTYEEKTATIAVTVVDYATALTVNATETTLRYNAETTLDLVANATYTLTMASGATKSVTEGITASDYKAGLNTITYTYTDEYATLTATQQYEIWYEITGDALAEWAVMQGNLAGYYRLTKDLDFGDAKVTPLSQTPIQGGDDTTCDVPNPAADSLAVKGVPFTGKFDGQGHIIKWVKVEGSSFTAEGFGLSLFGYIGQGAEVKNFILSNATIKSKNQTGFVSTYNEGLIENVVVNSSCSITANWLTAGVVVYNRATGVVRNVVCYTETAVKEDNVTTGALNAVYANLGTVEKCFAVSQEDFLTASAVLGNVEGWTYIEGSGPYYKYYAVLVSKADTMAIDGSWTFTLAMSEGLYVDVMFFDGVETYDYEHDSNGVFTFTPSADIQSRLTVGQTYNVRIRVAGYGYLPTQQVTITDAIQEGL